ncbi:MAG: gamma-glutamyltransferase [Candidatus Rokubacteria bacterium]|nr:gamma-glutamyltransferase [Candidatus Rokubacteria bacterium]
MPQIGYAHRPVALGREGMVAAAHPLATLTGIELLKAGGNAADAAVAVNAVLAVTQPNMCGLGGDIFVLYYEAASRRVHCLVGAGRSGSRASLEELARRGLSRVPALGPAAVSVPGCARGWAMLLERFGTRTLADLLGPAMQHAEAGFPATRLLSQSIAERGVEIRDPEWQRIFFPGGRAPRLGELLRQPDLARTLRALAKEGPDAFYRGRIAEALARRLEAEGFLTLEDLQAHTGEWTDPIAAAYRGYTVYETPPPTQGLAALLALNLLEGFDLAKMAFHSADHLHLLLEIVKLAYADRDRWVADPAHARVPVDELLAKVYAARRRQAFDPEKAQGYRWGEPAGDTTGFVIADRHGNLVSVIQSLFHAFGSGVVPEGTGVVLQSRGSHFSTDPSHPNCLAPRKRPFHTLIAALVTRDDRPALGFATMGSEGQAMFHAQVLTNVLDFGMDIQEAIERPRFLAGRFKPEDAAGDGVWLEGRIPKRSVSGLARRGHRVEVVSDFFHRMGHAHGIVVRDGTLIGGADPRGDGLALGY